MQEMRDCQYLSDIQHISDVNKDLTHKDQHKCKGPGFQGRV